MVEALTQAELEAVHCWDPNDRVPGRPAMTEFRRELRYCQAQWRDAHDHPIGTQPIAPRPQDKVVRPVGSRLPLQYAKETGATFVTPAALAAARERTSWIEPHQSFDHQRLWAELLWSSALSFNLFGDVAANVRLADRAVRKWWSDLEGSVSEVRFAHSPGRFDPDYLGNLIDLDVAVLLDMKDGTKGVLGIDVNYHDRVKPEEPKPIRVALYGGVAEKSGVFAPGAIDTLNRRNDLFELWLTHLLVLSMVQHPSAEWGWGRLVVVYPAGSPDFADACARYRDLLVDESTFSSITIEGLLDADALPPSTIAALRDRYVPCR